MKSIQSMTCTFTRPVSVPGALIAVLALSSSLSFQLCSAVPMPPVLVISTEPGSMTLSAAIDYQGWIVQSANESLGPYVDAGFMSAGGFNVPTTGAAEFYRLADPTYSLYSVNVVGYVNQVWLPGDHLINNPLDDGTNTVSSLFAGAPVGTMVKLWDPTANDYASPTIKQTTGWNGVNYPLPPSVGARLYSPVSYTNLYVGEVAGALPPPPFSGPDGTYLLGTTTPITVSGEDVFLWTLGRGPNVGEQFSTLTNTTTYLGGGAWDNGEPSLGVGESAFFTIPEPTTLSLLGLGSLALVMVRRRRWHQPPPEIPAGKSPRAFYTNHGCVRIARPI